MVTYDALNFWHDNDLHDHNIKIAPNNKGKIICNEHAQQFGTIMKYTLQQYPERSRPVLTNMCNAETNVITERIYKTMTIRIQTPKKVDVVGMIIKAYFKKDWEVETLNFKKNILCFDANKTKEWLDKAKNTDMKDKAVKDLLDSGLLLRPISDIKVHLKTESLLKDEPIKSIR